MKTPLDQHVNFALRGQVMRGVAEDRLLLGRRATLGALANASAITSRILGASARSLAEVERGVLNAFAAVPDVFRRH